jgi:hypothetical protein
MGDLHHLRSARISSSFLFPKPGSMVLMAATGGYFPRAATGRFNSYEISTDPVDIQVRPFSLRYSAPGS